MTEDERMRLVMAGAEALMQAWFPKGIWTDDKGDWENSAMLDSEVVVDELIRIGVLGS